MSLPRTPLLLIASLAVALVPLALAEPPKPDPEAARFTRLIKQLGSESFRERQAASRELAGIGEPALGALQQALHHRDAEVRRRAAVLVGPLIDRRERAALQGVWVLKKTEYLGETADQDLTEIPKDQRGWKWAELAEERELPDELAQCRTTLEFANAAFVRREPFSGGCVWRGGTTEGTYLLHAGRSPKRMDLLWGERSVRHCVYAVRGDTLRMGVSLENNPNNLPKRWATDTDEDVVVLTFRRDKR